MVIRLVMDFGELVKLPLIGVVGKVVVGTQQLLGLLGFIAFMCVWVYFCCCSDIVLAGDWLVCSIWSF
jgi:hypothetical protein